MTPQQWVALMLGVTGVIYVITSGAYYFASRPGMALGFVGYVIGNIGFAWDALGGK